MPFMIAAGIGAVGSIASGLIGSSASSKAAKQQADATRQATAAEQQMFGIQQADLQPYMEGGTNSLAALQKVLGIGPGGAGATNPILQMLGFGGPNATPGGGGIDPSNFQASPGYQFQLQQGEEAITNSNAAHGIGGNALKALQTYGQGTANQGWNQYLQQLGGAYGDLTGNLTNLTRIGGNAAAGAGNGALDTGKLIGGNLTDAGAANAAGTVGSANALSGAFGGVGNSVNQYALMNYLQGLQQQPGQQPMAGAGPYTVQPYVNGTLPGNDIMSVYG